MTSGSRFVPLSFRHFFLADIISLKTMDRAVLRLRQPFVLRVGPVPAKLHFRTNFTQLRCVARLILSIVATPTLKCRAMARIE